ncbi:MAG: hypothetical protein ACRBDI_05355 [Alphaproteobacteria bacterium]
MKKLYFSVGMALSLLLPQQTHARPVSYPGGITGMTMNNGDLNSVHIHYSPTAFTSIGYKGEYWRNGEYGINAIQMNNLLKRWNKPDSQANLYLKSGLGVAYSDKDAFDHKTEAATFTGIATDWENRRFFASYENRYTHAGDIDNFFTQSARIGVAPYIGEYGDTHTWLMLQVEHTPEAKNHVTLTPLVRLFKDVHMAEFGMNNYGELLFNYVIRY